MALGDSPQRPCVVRRRARDEVDDAAELLPGVTVLTEEDIKKMVVSELRHELRDRQPSTGGLKRARHAVGNVGKQP